METFNLLVNKNCQIVEKSPRGLVLIIKKFYHNKIWSKIIIRPKYLASDKASSDNAWLHAVKYIEKLDKIDIIVGVQPISPIRCKFDFDKAIGKL